MKANRLRCVLQLTVLTLLCSGCVTLGNQKTLLVDWPDYFDLPAGSTLVLQIDRGAGPHSEEVTTQKDMGCYSLTAQADAMAIKKENG